MVKSTDGPRTDRRANHALREVLDELIDYVRKVSTEGGGLTDDEVDYAQQRLQWLADEVWRLALEGKQQAN